MDTQALLDWLVELQYKELSTDDPADDEKAQVREALLALGHTSSDVDDLFDAAFDVAIRHFKWIGNDSLGGNRG